MSFEDALATEYVAFFHKAERERRWSIFDDVPWDRPPRAASAEVLDFVSTLREVKSSLAHVAGGGPLFAVDSVAADEFSAAWRFEESRHRLALADWARRGSSDETPGPESVRATPAWAKPLSTPRERAALAYLGELLTFAACSLRTGRASGRAAGDSLPTDLDPCLRRILDFVARDDIAHARFFEAGLRLLSRDDARGTALDFDTAATALRALTPRFAGLDLDERVLGPALARLGVDASLLGPKKAREALPLEAAGRRS